LKLKWLAVAALMAALYLADKSLATLETREVTSEAKRHYAKGQKLLAAGSAAAAVDEFRHAHTLERTNRDFDLALASAELTAGADEEAETSLTEILARNSNDGRANFLMARVRLAQDRFDDAVPFYHRAIYGAWKDGTAADKMDARLELADELAQRGRNEELLSELLLLDSQADGHPKLAAKLAGLYLRAGSLARAETAYRAILRESPADADAFAGLGETELIRGEYRIARAAFGGVLKYLPDDARATARIALADQLAEMDPTSRRLGSQEKFRRSSLILTKVVQETVDCAKSPDAALPDLLAKAARLQAEKVRSTPSNESAESRLEMATEIWKARLKLCTAQPGTDDPLRLLFAKMQQ
jgi:thioredoxin-like negative regulator of GroEL